MPNFEIVTDTNSGLTPNEAAEKCIHIIPMPCIIDGETYYENKDISYSEFFERLASGAEVSTSQPAPADILHSWDEALKHSDTVVYIPMSSGLSGTYETAKALSLDYEGRVFVVNNKRISVTLRAAVEDAIALRAAGKSAEETAEILENTAMDADIYVAVNTLEYLKKGGRITPAAATIGSVLGIKPVLRVGGGKLDAFKKVRGMKNAMQTMADALYENSKTVFSDGEFSVLAAYSEDLELGKEWQRVLQERFPNISIKLDALPISISCHVGPGALGVGMVRKYNY